MKLFQANAILKHKNTIPLLTLETRCYMGKNRQYAEFSSLLLETRKLDGSVIKKKKKYSHLY